MVTIPIIEKYSFNFNDKWRRDSPPAYNFSAPLRHRVTRLDTTIIKLTTCFSYTFSLSLSP